MTNRLSPLMKKRNTKGRYYKYAKYPVVPLSFNDIYIITKSEDRLDLLAEQFYGDTELWWIITIANLGKIKRDSFFVKGGLQIRIPQDTQSVIDEYKRINS
tara:strand:+ start:175 stop:477 length:303 start_codon:yes stop_codon:yes gene_type:complete